MQEIKQTLKTPSGAQKAKLTKIQEHSSHQELQEQKEKKELTKIQGILTSNLRTRKSSDTPYMAFFRPERDCKEHTIEECERTKCQECEIPVIFRWISKNHRVHEMEPKEECFNEKEHWQNPNLKKGDKVILEGKFSESKDSNRPSFTCYSYQLISHGR